MKVKIKKGQIYPNYTQKEAAHGGGLLHYCLDQHISYITFTATSFAVFCIITSTSLFNYLVVKFSKSLVVAVTPLSITFSFNKQFFSLFGEGLHK